MRRSRIASAAALAGLLLIAPFSGAATAAPGAPGAPGASDGEARSRADAPHARSWWDTSLALDDLHRTVTGKGVVIALIDEGLEANVPALKGAHVEMMPSPCLIGQKRTTPGYSSYRNSHHGSEMASLLVGGGNGVDGPGTGIMGMAPDATLRFYQTRIPTKGGRSEPCDRLGIQQTAQRAIDDGADVVSMSFGGGYDVNAPQWEKQVARNKAVMVAASPASGTTLPQDVEGVPAGIPGIVAVNAFDRGIVPWKQSMWVNQRDESRDTFGWNLPAISAPGVHLVVPGAAVGYQHDAWVTGTSPATALVAGSLALVKQKYPDATPNQLIQNLIHHTGWDNVPRAERPPDMRWDKGLGFGNVSTKNMLEHDPAGWPDENPLLVDPTTMGQKYPSSIYGKARSTSPAAASASPSASSAGDASASPGSRASGATSSGPRDRAGAPAAVWIAVAVLLALVLGVAATVAARRRRTTTTTARPGGTDASGTDDHLTRAGGQ